MQYFALEPPIKLQAGLVGDKPTYFDCATCGAKEPEIAGCLANSDATATGPVSFDKIGILTPKDGKGGFPRHALFCADCFKKIQSGVSESDIIRETIERDNLAQAEAFMRHDPLSEPAVSAASTKNQKQKQQQSKHMNGTTPAANTRTAVFEKSKETPGAVQFKEVEVEGQPPVSGTLYLKKYVVGKATTVRMTVELS